MPRILAGPFNRVEGDLEIELQTSDNQVLSARVNSPLYRGFEQILLQREPMDALVYTPRICGICSVSQSVACARALGELMQVKTPANGLHCTNLVLANESMADLLTHFYLFFMPDFAREAYANESWFDDINARFKALKGTAAQAMLPARAEFLHLMGIMAGKWPHSLSIQPGGTAKSIDQSERIRLLAILSAFRRFLESQVFGDSLDIIASLNSQAELDQWRLEKDWTQSDLRRFLHLSETLELASLGRTKNQFLSFGAYAQPHTQLLASGVYILGEYQALDMHMITEDHSYAWLQPVAQPTHPQQGVTVPVLENEQAYSWCKAPRYQQQVMEVGALARQMLNRHPLAVDMVQQQGANVHSRMVARLLELALVVPKMQEWVKAIEPKAPFCVQGELPRSGQAVGMVEAARGSLAHWISVEEGKISNYQIVAPTTWNFSPRDQQGVAGALEAALEGAPIRANEKTPLSVQHIVRSFDPCMSCTVH